MLTANSCGLLITLGQGITRKVMEFLLHGMTLLIRGWLKYLTYSICANHFGNGVWGIKARGIFIPNVTLIHYLLVLSWISLGRWGTTPSPLKQLMHSSKLITSCQTVALKKRGTKRVDIEIPEVHWGMFDDWSVIGDEDLWVHVCGLLPNIGLKLMGNLHVNYHTHLSFDQINIQIILTGDMRTWKPRSKKGKVNTVNSIYW